MPPSQRSSGRSADELNSEGRLSRRSSKYIDIDIAGDAVAVETKSRSSQLRSDRGRSRRSDAGNGDKELHVNLQIEVDDRRFYLHKFPLLSKSNKLNRLVVESRGTEVEPIVLSDMPGGAQAFEFLARYFYGGKVELSPYNVAAVRCAAEYLEVTGEHNNNSNLVTRIENYLNYEVSDSWRDSVTVLKTCSELIPWSEDLEIIRRCSESIAWKCCELPRKGRATDWWFDDVCSLSIDTFTRVIHAIIAKGNSGLVISAVEYYAERWLQLTKGSDMSTTMKPAEAASFVAFTGFNQDIVAKDAKQTQHKNRAILQGIVKLLPSESSPHIPSVKFLLKLLRVACLVNAGAFCKTDLTNRIASQLEKVSVDDLLIPASGESTYDVDVVQQIVEFYIQEQSYDNSPPLSPRSSVSTLTSSVSSSSLSSVSLSTDSRSSRSTESRSSLSDSASDSESDSGSSISGSSSSRSYRSGRSFRSGSSQVSGSSRSSSSRSSSTSRSSSSMSYTSGSFSESSEGSSGSSSSSSSSSRSGDSSDESVKLEIKKKAFYVTDTSNASRAAPLPPTSANFKVAQLLETYLEEIAKDSSIAFAQFLKLVELFTEFPRVSDDSIYRAIDGFLRTHPSLADTDRKSLCRLMDTGALSLAASVHAASNERLPIRVIVQLLFNEQIKIRNEMTGNEVINEKDLGGKLPSFSSSSTSTSSTESSSSRDGTSSSGSLSSGTSSSTSASSGSTRKSSRSISRASSEAALNQLVIVPAPPRSPSVASSPLLGGLSVKETLRFVLAEIESLRKSVQEIETVKSKLATIDTLQLEIEHLSSKFQDMAQDYVGMTQQVEELTKGSKQVKSGWSSGWKKVTKTFQSKDQEHKNETPPLPPLKLPSQGSDLPVLRTSKSDTLHPKTPRADMKAAGRADSMPVTKRTPTKSNESVTLHPNTPRADASPVARISNTDSTISKAVKVESLPPTAGNSVSSTPRVPKKETIESRDSSFRTNEQEIVPKSGEMSVKGKEGYAITAHRSHHVEDVHRRSVRSRSASPEQQKDSHRSEQKGSQRSEQKGSQRSEQKGSQRSEQKGSQRSEQKGSQRSEQKGSQRSEQKGSQRSDSVTSTSSYSTTSSARSGGHRYRQRRSGHRESSSLNKERYNRNPRSHNGHSHKEHSVDSRHRHSSATQGGQSGHHRGHHEGSVASHHTKEGSERHSVSQRSAHRHSHHRRDQSFSDDSGASGDFVARSRRSQH